MRQYYLQKKLIECLLSSGDALVNTLFTSSCNLEFSEKGGIIQIVGQGIR